MHLTTKMDSNNKKSRYDKIHLDSIKRNQRLHDESFTFFGSEIRAAEKELQEASNPAERKDVVKRIEDHYRNTLLPCLDRYPWARVETQVILMCHVERDLDPTILEFVRNNFNERFFSCEVYIGFLKWYEDNCTVLQSRFEENLTKTMTKMIIPRIKELVRRGEIPLSEEEVMQRIETVRLRFTDPLSLLQSGSDALFYPDARTIHQKIARNSEVIHDFAHELIHAIAGVSFYDEVFRSHDEDDVDQILEYAKLREGLRFYDGKNLSWLDEGVTELFAMRIMGKKTPIVYHSEMELLQLLLASGKIKIPFPLVSEAYFIDSGADSKSAWKRLFDMIEKAYDPHFLGNLNHAICSSEDGAQAGIQYLKEYIAPEKEQQQAA